MPHARKAFQLIEWIATVIESNLPYARFGARDAELLVSQPVMEPPQLTELFKGSSWCDSHNGAGLKTILIWLRVHRNNALRSAAEAFSAGEKMRNEHGAR
jgi:hypothetical protein